VKATTLTLPVLEKILKQAKDGRFFILEKMLSVLPKSRTKVSKYAPKIETLHIPVEKIGEVIGPGGKVIKNIIAETGANVDIEDDGTVSVSSLDKESVKKAMDWVEGLVREVEVNEIFEEGIVRRIQPFGAFVEILPGKDGLVHVSKMSTEYVEDPNDVVKEGQKVRVKVVEVDDLGRINLSMIFDSQKQDNSENNSTRDPREDQKPSYKKDKFSRNPRR